MAKRRKSSKGPDPINAFLDIAGATTMGLYVKHKVKKDFEHGCGKESAKAAAMVFGMGSTRRGSQGTINLGGLVGLNSALKDIERQQATTYIDTSRPYVSPIEPPTPVIKKPVKTGLWRGHCGDGSQYGLYPGNFATADDYADALQAAKKSKKTAPFVSEKVGSLPQQSNKYRWRKHCEAGSKYGLDPKDFETEDDYQDAINARKQENAYSEEFK